MYEVALVAAPHDTLTPLEAHAEMSLTLGAPGVAGVASASDAEVAADQAPVHVEFVPRT